MGRRGRKESVEEGREERVGRRGEKRVKEERE